MLLFGLCYYLLAVCLQPLLVSNLLDTFVTTDVSPLSAIYLTKISWMECHEILDIQSNSSIAARYLQDTKVCTDI